MSYVLEALRRAEAERQRGRVPGLDAQPLAAPERAASPSASRRPPWWVPAGALALAGAGLAAWFAWPARPDAPPAAGPSTAVPGAAPITAAPAPRTAPRTAPPVAPPLAPSLVPPPAVRAPAPAPASRVAPAPAPAPAAEARVVRWQDLPETTRRQLPALAFGGASDSPEPSARMLIINGQLWREGDEPAPGLRLERISLRAAVFRWRDQRIEIAY